MGNHKKNQKLFVVKKYVMASSARDALRKEMKIPADDCWIDEDFKKDSLVSAIGYRTIDSDKQKPN